MSIYLKPLSQIEPTDLEELVKDKAVENIRLEFKSELPEKDELLKKLSSFANSYGGFLVVGAKANSANGRIHALPGVDEQAGYKQKIVQWGFDAVSPPLVVEVSEAIPVADNKFCYVIYVAESEVAPHFLNGRNGVWLRTDEFSQRYEPRLATENELRHLLDRRQIVQGRRSNLIDRSRRRFEMFRSKQAKGPADELRLKKAPRLELSIGPRFPVRPVCEQARLATILENCRIPWSGTTFPYSNARLIYHHESAIFLPPPDAHNQVGFVEANIWGPLFYGIEIHVEMPQKDEQTKGIHSNQLAANLLLWMEHAKRMISSIGYEGSLLVDVRLSDINNIPWFYPEGCSELDTEFSFTVATTADVVRERRDEVVKQMLEDISFGANLDVYRDDSKWAESLLRNAYRYALWQ